jgi:hypothetical protein
MVQEMCRILKEEFNMKINSKVNNLLIGSRKINEN